MKRQVVYFMLGCEPTIVGPDDFNPGSYLNHAANEFGPVSVKNA